jgi:hypothetical protein
MALRNRRPFRITPIGVVDSLDGTNAPPGACAALADLIPDQTTAGMWQCRPAAVKLTSFSGFTSPGFISGLLVVGNIAYGMVASGRNSGHDEPFAYNLATGAFLSVSGVTAGNTPASPPSSGAWTPPILCAVGSRILVCHPGFPGGATKFGWFDVSGFSASLTISVTSGSATFTSTSNMLQAGLQPGQVISNPAFPTGTAVVSIAADGMSAVASQAATVTSSGAVSFAGGTSAAPLWGAGDCNINNLPSTPLGVAQFNGRAYFACGVNGVVFSDSLLPCNRTQASQALNFGNGLATTAIGGLPLASPLTGGIIQAIIAFQGTSVMQQITGDPTTSNLAVNALDVETGTSAPLSVVPTKFGLAFLSPDGLRYIDFGARVSEPLGAAGDGVTSPFINALYPARVAVAANARALRATTQNAAVSGQPSNEYWYDLARKAWCGPHRLACDQIQPWGSTFVVVMRGVNAALFQSDVVSTSSSSFIENGTQLSYTLTTALSPDGGDMRMQSVKAATVFAVYSQTTAPVVTVLDDQGSTLDSVAMMASSSSEWGVFPWGQAQWAGTVATPRQHLIPWHAPLVFKQGKISLTGQSGNDVRLGNLYFEAKSLGQPVYASN